MGHGPLWHLVTEMSFILDLNKVTIFWLLCEEDWLKERQYCESSSCTKLRITNSKVKFLHLVFFIQFMVLVERALILKYFSSLYKSWLQKVNVDFFPDLNFCIFVKQLCEYSPLCDCSAWIFWNKDFWSKFYLKTSIPSFRHFSHRFLRMAFYGTDCINIHISI